MNPHPQHRFHATALVALALVLTAGAARSEDEPAPEEATAAAAETPAWDQAQVTEIAKELAATIDPLRTALREQPPPQRGSGQTNSQTRLRDTLRQLRNSTEQLVARLEAGAGREETFPIFQRIQELRRVAAEDGRRIFISDQVGTSIEATREPLGRLAPYFGQTFEPGLKKRTQEE